MRWSTVYRSKIVLLFVGTFMVLLGNSPALAVDATGSVGTWTTSASHAPLDVSGAASVTVNGYAYLIGGSSSSGGT